MSSDTVAMCGAFSDFAAPGFAAAAVVAGGAVLLRRGRTQVVVAALCVAATGAQIVPLAPRWVAETRAPARASFTVLELNARLGHADPAELTKAARTADLVVLTETTGPQVRALSEAGFTDRFGYRNAGRLPDRGGAGTAVFSRFPISGTEQLSPRLGHQNWVCTVEVPGAGPVEVVAVHPARPHLGGSRWLAEQRELEAALPTSGLRLVAGDFNAVASHATLRALRGAGWTSSVDQAGAGWTPTYPADSSRVPALIDIDHVYLSTGLQATRVQTVSVAGTDHRGLLVNVDVTTP